MDVCMIDKMDKEVHVFQVMNNRTQSNLLSILKSNVYIINNELENDLDDIDESFKTRMLRKLSSQ